ncbi:hypothetical protein NDU88_001739 [Pleurodeles waltl]|uniref:Uncharacterized protein n=1 Tax=Pleurodeles waltl TaxID=8319 RepID=A0AAV7UB48_PLEWA|nr:hypothetical protein NDU88_001739 [Pleurodeles waltl]
MLAGGGMDVDVVQSRGDMLRPPMPCYGGPVSIDPPADMLRHAQGMESQGLGVENPPIPGKEIDPSKVPGCILHDQLDSILPTIKDSKETLDHKLAYCGLTTIS